MNRNHDRRVLCSWALVLLLPAGTEPSSPAMTNASAERTLEVVAPKKPSRRARAKAVFLRAEQKREAYLRIQVTIDQRSLAEKVKEAESLAKDYRAVIAKKDPEYTLAAWVRIAEIYLHFAEQIRRAEGADRSELQAMALGPERRAREALERGSAHAGSHDVRGVWKRRLDRLH